MIRFLLVAALVLVPSASAKVVFFQTPSHNIGCAYSSSPANLRCDILSGLKPAPRKPPGCQNDWTFGYQVGATGRARKVCAGDSVYSSRARTISYGSTWKQGGFTCLSKRTGLRCKNRSGHGFFLSRARSYRF